MQLEGVYQDQKCVIKSANITGSETVKFVCNPGTSVGGAHAPAIKYLELSKGKVQFLPRGFPNIFPNLISLSITGCGLEKITASDLLGLEILTDLKLDENKLISLPSDLFVNMKSLERISFKNNEIRYLTSKLFDHSEKLKFANFQGNKAIDVKFSQDSPTFNSIEQLKGTIESCCLPPIEERTSTTDQLFTELWESKKFSDFIIEVGLKEFQAHRCVLGLQSSVLAATLDSDMEEAKNNRLKIVDFSAEAVEHFLEFLYTGKLEDRLNALEVFGLSVKYDVKNLQMLATDLIMDSINESNVVVVLGFAILHDSSHIKRAAFATVKIIVNELDLDKGLMENPLAVKELIETKRDLTALTEKYEKLLISHRI